uniref:methylmalonate-semialdehyde dehydrogenase (CoA acylating) n=2 Tax=Octactis speculum TaxID=3111310 RepID=A0A7S2B8N1_9STRA
MGNCVILKPSEKVPLTMKRVAELIHEAGIPKGVFQMVQGTRTVVEALCDHPKIAGVTFVGSSPVAKAVATRCRANNKRVLALGGAKNHLIALPDCDVESTAQDIVASFAGAAGQRCMAASVLVLVASEGATGTSSQGVLARVIEKTLALQPGIEQGQVGAVIDERSKTNILKFIEDAEKIDGAQVLVDGRSWASSANDGSIIPPENRRGFWVGPTVLLHKSAADAACTKEIFGPVLSVLRVRTWADALNIENANPFGNAACIYTSSGEAADYFAPRFRAGMIGVNVGIPVPREPFSFGGMYGTQSKYGEMDITGEGCVEFCTNRRKITSRWPRAQGQEREYASSGDTACQYASLVSAPIGHNRKGAGAPEDVDHANFNGNM